MSAILIILLYLGVAIFDISFHAYAWKDSSFQKAIVVLLGLGFLFPLLGCFLAESKIQFFFLTCGHVFLGWLFYEVLYLLVLVLFVYLKKATFKTMIILAAVLAFITNGYGMIHAQDIRLKEYDIIAGKAAVKDEITIVFISDLHMSVNTSKKSIIKMVELINNADCDLILGGGDYFTSTCGGLKDPDESIDLLSKMKAKYGVYGIYGDHDDKEKLLCGLKQSSKKTRKRPLTMDDFMKQSGIVMLEDEVIKINGLPVTLIGRQSLKAPDHQKRQSVKQLESQIDHDDYMIVLEHEPVELRELAKSAFDLTLSGHTYGGQIFPLSLGISLFYELGYGHRCVDQMDAIVSSGIGTCGPPLRIGTNAEVVIIHIKPYQSNETLIDPC